MESRNKRLAKNTLFLYLRMMLVMGVTLYTSRVVLEVLGFTDYGVYNVVGGVVAIFGFLNGAMSGASFRFLSFELGRKDYERLNKVFNVLVVSHLFIASCVVILGETIGLWFLYHKLVIPENQLYIVLWVYQLSIISSVLSILNVPYTATIISYEDMHVYAYVGLVEAGLKLTVVFLLMVIPGNKLLLYAILLLGVQILINTTYLIYCKTHYTSTSLHLCKEKFLYREILGFVGGDLIGNISVLAQGQGLNILLNLFFGPVVNAARGLTTQVQGAVQMFSNNYVTAFRPQIIKLCAERNYKELFPLVEQGSCIAYYLMWYIILPVLLNSQYILTLWLGKFPEYTIPFLNIVLWISMVNTIKYLRVMIFHGLGKIKLVNAVIGGILIMTFPISYIWLKMGGSPTSVFYISLFLIILTEFISSFILKRYIDFSILHYLKSVHLRCIYVTIISGIIPFWYNLSYSAPSLKSLIISTCISILCISGTVFTVGLSSTARNRVLSIIRTKIVRRLSR